MDAEGIGKEILLFNLAILILRATDFKIYFNNTYITITQICDHISTLDTVFPLDPDLQTCDYYLRHMLYLLKLHSLEILKYRYGILQRFQ